METKTKPVCKRCKGLYGDPNIKGGICGTCADDLRGEPS